MLDSLRQKSTGFVSLTFIGLIALSMGLWGIQNFFSKSGHDKDHFTIAGEKLTAPELRLYAQNSYIEISKALPGLNKEGRGQIAQMKAYYRATQRVIMGGYATDIGMVGTPAEAAQTIASMPLFQSQDQLEASNINQVLNALSFPETDFVQTIDQLSVAHALNTTIEQSDFMLPFELKSAARLAGSRRDFMVLNLAPAKIAKHQHPSEKALKAYYNAHAKKGTFQRPEEVKLQYVELSEDHLMKKLKPTTAELKTFFEERQANFKRDGKQLAFAAAREQVSQAWKQNKASMLYAQALEDIENLAFTDEKKLAPIAKAYQLKLETTGFISKSGSQHSKLTQNKAVLEAAFSDDLLKDHVNSAPIKLDDTHVAVLRMLKHNPVKPLSYSEAKAQVRTKLQDKMANDQIKQLSKALKTGTDLAVQLQRNGLSWSAVKAQSIPMTQASLDPVLRAGFSIPSKNVNQPKAIEVKLSNNRTAWVKLTKVYEDGQAYLKRLHAFNMPFSKAWGQFINASYFASRSSRLA